LNTIAIIPARGGSKGLPNKNILSFCEKPLISYTIEAAINSKYIDKVIVSTDCPKIAEVSKQYGADVPFLRPQELATDDAKTIDVLKHAVQFLEEQHYNFYHIVLLQPTSPLRNEKHIDESFDLYLKNKHIPVVSVCKANTHPYIMRTIEDGYLKPFLQTDNLFHRRQEFPDVYELNGAIYITHKEYIKKGLLYEESVLPYIMDKEYSVDIDDKIDFIIAETIYKNEVSNHV
jgi:CMP-N,N'-diacetyllegionaminic acid synthase